MPYAGRLARGKSPVYSGSRSIKLGLRRRESGQTTGGCLPDTARTGPTLIASRDARGAAAIRAYAAACRARVPAFAARHFGWRGALRLHRAALGFDLLRAPFNVMMVAPTLLLRILAWAAGRSGLGRVSDWLAKRDLFVETALARRVADLVLGELLQVDRAGSAFPPEWHERARGLIAEYVAVRHAAAEFGAGCLAILIGLATLHALTPSAITMGPLLAQELAQREAIQGFWLGSGLGSLWYAWFPPEVDLTRTIGITAAAMAGFALVATFIGILVDPLLHALGLHRRRLGRLVDTFERAALGDDTAKLRLPDLYLARLVDLADIALLALRMTR
ncbi:MAG: DUF6635 family protein [Reyranellaceae bacterium]